MTEFSFIKTYTEMNAAAAAAKKETTNDSCIMKSTTESDSCKISTTPKTLYKGQPIDVGPEYLYKSMNCHENRLQSFNDNEWKTKNNQQDIYEMASAGFYYLGYGDYTMCYSCKVGVHSWNITDNPWIEHVFWSPSCTHILKIKGERFMESVHNNFKQHKQN